jgi:hypothetical protein
MSAKARISAVLIAAITLCGATLARAESSAPELLTPQQQHKTLQWDAKGRWSLKLDMNEQAVRGVELRDVQAGAYYHLTPSLKVGGAVTFGDDLLQADHNNIPQVPVQAPRVKLETSFKF